MTIVIKPNFVLSKHKEGKDIFSTITHPSVMRAVADFCWIALKGYGKITFADAPQYDCNWEELMQVTKLEKVVTFYSEFQGPRASLFDLRNYWSRDKHFPSMLLDLKGDPEGDIVVNLGKRSALYDNKVNYNNLYGAVYHRQELISHHIGDKQEYKVSSTIMNADVVISVPKLKVHKKVGVTLNAKGLVGINTNKNYLVHYTLKTPKEGGDQFPEGYLTPMENSLIKIERWMYDHFLAKRSLFLEYIHRSIYWLHARTLKPLGITIAKGKRLLDAGNWYGNDSAWRMVVDLMRIFHFSDSKGNIQNKAQRKVFTIIDGIIGGEKKGPLTPDPNLSSILIAGENLLAADIVATRLMGFDPKKLKMYTELMNDNEFDFGVKEYRDIIVHSNIEEYENCLNNKSHKYLNYVPFPGWVGHIEI